MSEITIKAKSRKTGEVVTLPLSQFKIKFQNELQQAYLSYSQHETTKNMLKPLAFMKDITCNKSDFYFDLRWNFNNYAMSEWYIDKIF